MYFRSLLHFLKILKGKMKFGKRIKENSVGLAFGRRPRDAGLVQQRNQPGQPMRARARRSTGAVTSQRIDEVAAPIGGTTA
jgi:hypothetical protein